MQEEIQQPMTKKSIANTTTVVGKPTPSGLFVYDSISVWPKKIYFEWVTEGFICTTRHGATIWGYRFLDERKVTVWEAQYGDPDAEKAIRFAKRRNRFLSMEDQFNWGRLFFEKTCEKEGIEFESVKEKWDFYREFREEHLKETGFDMDDLYHSKAAIAFKRSRPGSSS